MKNSHTDNYMWIGVFYPWPIFLVQYYTEIAVQRAVNEKIIESNLGVF